jgi:hypothetical protein
MSPAEETDDPALALGQRALITVNQWERAALSGLAVPTIQLMDASDDVIGGTVDPLMKLIAALDAAGIKLAPRRGRSVMVADVACD